MALAFVFPSTIFYIFLRALQTEKKLNIQKNISSWCMLGGGQELPLRKSASSSPWRVPYLWKISFVFRHFSIQKAKSLLLRVSETAAAAVKSLQSCPTLYDPIEGSPPGSPVSGILQARILEWVATSFSNAWKWKLKVKSLSRVRLVATPWTAGYQAPPSMGFSRQEYWSGVPLPSPLSHKGSP